MKPFTNGYNLFLGTVVTILTAVFGVYWYIFVAYMILNVIDWLTGWWKSRKSRQESSAVGLKGIIKKLGYWIIIAVAFLMSRVFVQFGSDILNINLGFLVMIGWFTLACLMVNEVRSILENLVELGYDVPKVLIDGLEVTEKLVKSKEVVNDGDTDESSSDKGEGKE